MSKSPTKRHQDVQFRLRGLLERKVPEGFVVSHAQPLTADGDSFVPDLMVHAASNNDERLTTAPILVVDIMSSDSAADMAGKLAKFASAGVRNYWLVDPESPTIAPHVLENGGYEGAPRVDADGKQSAKFTVGDAVVGIHPANLNR